MLSLKVLSGPEVLTDSFKDHMLWFHVKSVLLITLYKQEQIVLREEERSRVCTQESSSCFVSLRNRKRCTDMKSTVGIWCLIAQ